VDRAPLTPTEFSAAVTAITSAFGDRTRREVYLFAHEQEAGVTAAEVADQFGMHPNVARHHLDKLAVGGYLDVTVARTSGGAGRPSKRYRASARDMAIEFPVRRDDLLVALLGRALSRMPRAEAETMAEEVGVEYGRALAGAMGPSADTHRSFRVALHAVADALTAHGFAARTEERGSELRIVSEHCPFGGAPIDHPVICAVDRGMVRGMLGALYGESTASTASSRPQGDDVCVTAVGALAGD
jgi:predicted ArsR family transcriptional regulator